MAKKTLTQNEIYQLEGLLVLAAKVQSQAAQLRYAVCELVGEDPDDFGHASDAVYSDGTNARELMKRMGIKVASSSKRG